MNLPNKLTLLRIILVPFFVASFYVPWKYQYILSAILFIVAAVTDLLDGKIARKQGIVTTFGKFMDPIADKILVLAAMVMLNAAGTLSPIITIIVTAREFLVSGVRLLMAEKGTVIAASWWGKAKTMTQGIGLALLLLKNPIFCIWNIPMDQIVIWISTVLAVISGYDYVKGAWKHIFQSK